jgi:transposase
MQTPAPARLIEGGIPTEAAIAQVLVSKYADHLPLYS